ESAFEGAGYGQNDRDRGPRSSVYFESFSAPVEDPHSLNSPQLINNSAILLRVDHSQSLLLCTTIII
ncbi:hypothetical protein PFISCL1PPCAC_22486, partial [Pristionchus fissidentatus]